MTAKPKTLHIFNGDCACNIWKKQGGKGAFLVWRENYLEGPLPKSVSNEDFERVRAGFLHSCIPKLDEACLLRFLLNLDRTVASLPAGETAVLWFDVCMFDQIMLARILYLMRETRAEIRLFCDDAVPKEAPEIYRRDIREARILSNEAVRTYAGAWIAAIGGAAEVEAFNRNNVAASEPALAEAMLRYGEDHPADGSPGKSERRLLEIVASGENYLRPDIFRRFNAEETHPFMGDTMCNRMLDDLAAAGKIIAHNDPVKGEIRYESKRSEAINDEC